MSRTTGSFIWFLLRWFASVRYMDKLFEFSFYFPQGFPQEWGFSNLSIRITQRLLRIWVPGSPAQSFWFRRLKMEPVNLHHLVLRQCWFCSSGDPTLRNTALEPLRKAFHVGSTAVSCIQHGPNPAEPHHQELLMQRHSCITNLTWALATMKYFHGYVWKYPNL